VNATRVTALIPVKDDERVVACVRSLMSLAGEVSELEVIVVENGSAEPFGEWLRKELPEPVKLLDLRQPGVYAARNLGVSQATGQYVFFTDADCVVLPGWFDAGLAAFANGADLVQGFSGSIGVGCVERLLQARYEKHLRHLREGDATECDTRNLAVRRTVFETLQFNDAYRRVGDTEFGLVAEASGYRVAYAPAMRIAHDHDPNLALFVAKQICHGWGAQRLMQQHPDVRWHGGHLRAVATMSSRANRLSRVGRLGASACRVAALTGARLLQRLACRLPGPVAYGWLTALDKLAALAGHLAYRPGADEPSPSAILGRDLPRD
jgi:glycosyltransferase involved in cell wall biosynthesis